MPAEKQNNISGKLDAMHSLPEGYSFRPHAVWNRLEPQLKKTAVNYRAVFFAAASFIAVIVFIALPSKRNNKTGPVVLKKAEIIPAKAVAETTVSTSNNPSPVSENQIAESPAGHRQISGSKTSSVIQKPMEYVVIRPDIPPQKHEEAPAPEVEKATQPVITVVTVKPKRRFPVAHANELNHVVPVEEEEPVTRQKTGFAFRRQSYDIAPPLTSFEEGFTERKKPKTIFPLLNSSQ